MTVLHSAMMFGSPSVVAAILRFGADPAIDSKIMCYSPLHVAAGFGRRDNVAQFLDYLEEEGETDRFFAILNDQHNQYRLTPAMAACLGESSNAAATLRELSKRGSDFFIADFTAWTCLHFAAACNGVEEIEVILDNWRTAPRGGEWFWL